VATIADFFGAVRRRDHDRVRELLAEDAALVHARDDDGATALHYAAEAGDSALANVLLDAGADINARDARFNATPAGWAIEYLRARGALLGMEIDDCAAAIAEKNVDRVRRYVTRLPALRDVLRDAARQCGSREIAALFE